MKATTHKVAQTQQPMAAARNTHALVSKAETHMPKSAKQSNNQHVQITNNEDGHSTIHASSSHPKLMGMWGGVNINIEAACLT